MLTSGDCSFKKKNNGKTRGKQIVQQQKLGSMNINITLLKRVL